MSNPFEYYKTPETRKQAQSNINHWWYESMATDCEIEESGFLPVQHRVFVREMVQQAKRDLAKLESAQ